MQSVASVPTLTFDSNRLGRVLSRRFNAAWREMAHEPVHILPQVARELMDRQIDPFDISTDKADYQRLLQRRANELSVSEKKWGQSVLWWAGEFEREDSPYSIIQLSVEQRQHAIEICERFPRDIFPDAKPDVPLSRHDDSLVVAQGLVSNSKVLITNDKVIRRRALNQWAENNASTLRIDSPFVLVLQDVYLHDTYVNRERLPELQGFALGAFFPAKHARPADVAERYLSTLETLNQNGSGFESTAKALYGHWLVEGAKEEICEQVRACLPKKMRASEERHPLKQDAIWG